MSRKPISKQMRQRVYNLYTGHCAYCGCELTLKDMQIDHIKSVYKCEYNGEQVDDTIDNYLPACRQCNFYKSTFDLETFRTRLTDVMLKNLQSNFNYKLALKYGLIQENTHPIKFYFETVDNKYNKED